MRRALLRLGFTCLLLAGLAAPAHAAKRVALVIGNDAYAQVPKLLKAVNDARAMDAALAAIGFEVVRAENVTRREMNRQLQLFASRLETGDEALFFYAGHGVEISGRNYLLPTDIPAARPGQEDFVATEAIPVDQVLDRIRARGTRVSILILDACRDNPFPRDGTRSLGGGRGLARMPAAEGTFIMYSAGVGQTALDRLSNADPDPNSVFTRKLVPLIRRPGVSLVQAAREVRREVQRLAATVAHDQRPAYYDEVTGEFFFAGRGGAGSAAAAAPAAEAPLSPAARAWELVKESEDEGVLKAFLKEYPEGLYAALAKARLKRIEEKKLAVGVYPDEPKPGATFRDCPDCPEMVVVPAGSFTMGSPESEEGRYSDEGPQRRVTIAKPFAVGKFEVTKAEFEAFVRESGHDAGSKCWTWDGKEWKERAGHSFRNPGFSQGGDHPVACVNWNDARAYLAWLGRKTGKSYRLLSEAEWEYAARAGTTTRFSFGDRDTDLCAYGNHADANTSFSWKNSACSDGVGERTAEVGRYKANAFGLHDMHGNVWEWTQDCWNDSYKGAPTDGSARTTGDCSQRVLRGGSWIGEPRVLRSADRIRVDSDLRLSGSGFRLARTVN